MEFTALDERFLNQPAFACSLSKDAAKAICYTTKECIHAANICESLEEMIVANQEFSNKAKRELLVLVKGVYDIVELATESFLNDDIESARCVEPLEEVIDGLNVKLRQRHIDRLRAGKRTIELGIALEDIITNLERVSDHCSNIAVCMIQVSSGNFDTHEYVDTDIKQTKWFYDEVKKYSEIYTLKEKEDTENKGKKKSKKDKKAKKWLGISIRKREEYGTYIYS